MTAWLRPALRFGLLLVTAAGAWWIWQRTLDDGAVRVTGTVVAAGELAVTSPIAARITEVHARVGDELAAGDPILSLDVGVAEQEAERIERELAITTSEELKAQLALNGSVAQVDALIDRQTIELRGLNIKLAGQRKLVLDGLATEEDIQPAVLAVQEAELELARLQEARWRLEQPGAGNVDSAAADRETLTLQALENRERLDHGTIRATRAAQVVQLHNAEGDYVIAGAVVARVADLTAFSILVTIDEDLAASQPWTRVRVLLDDEELAGAVAARESTNPGEVILTLDNPSHAGLRSGRRVEVVIEP